MRFVIPLAFALSTLGALALLLSGPGYRFEWWGLKPAFTIMRWAAYAGVGGAAAAVVGLVATRPSGTAMTLGVTALVLGVGVFWLPFQWARKARSVPPIHDITTDAAMPPEFVAILPLRADAPNTAEYGGPEVAEQQRAAYPDIQPLDLPVPPADAYDRARDAAVAMGWDVIAADSTDGRIEAVATTAWFGFKDDVVVRVRAIDGGSRIDVRSVSRVGVSDVGKNAERIRAYLARLNNRE